MSDLQIEYTDLDNLLLDPKNPRLGRSAHQGEPIQEEILELMRNWSLEEIGTSFLESGFWPHEAILCIEDDISSGSKKLIVVEGNRRVAALLNLRLASEGKASGGKWKKLLQGATIPGGLFEKVPYIKLGSRKEIDAFLGFRHVTGIKEWAPAEKAEFITHLINDRDFTYVEVMRKIGSKTEAVRRNYITYSLLLQMEGTEGIDVERVENKFSVLFLSLRNRNIQEFLGIDINAKEGDASEPVSSDNIENLREYATWLFGDNENEPMVPESRQVDKFATVLASSEALSYIRSVKSPKLDKAFKIAGGELPETIELIQVAAFNIGEALSSIHLYREDELLREAVDRLLKHAEQLKTIFPAS